MPDPADLPAARAPKVLGALAALACVACCALPALITAGVVGSGAGAVAGWLPAVAAALIALGAGTWWLGRRRVARGCGSSACGSSACGAGGCECQKAEDPLTITPAARR